MIHDPTIVFETHARGKLLLTGEYFVLDGALALALPVRFGQHLRVASAEENLQWRSLDQQGSVWWEAAFALPNLEVLQTTDHQVADTLISLLLACRRQNPEFLMDPSGLLVTTQIDFPKDWGLGTSSTLIAALARWAHADPYPVLFTTLGGSGYDLACANAQGPILYQLTDNKPKVQPVDFQPLFTDQLFFVYLEKKQDSRAGIAHYRAQAQGKQDLIEKMSRLTHSLLAATTLPEFESILLEHEQLVSATLDLPRAKDLFFKDYWGEIKSLGAWGGDFVLVTSQRSKKETQAYFNEKGCKVFIAYQDMTMYPPGLSS